MKRLYPALLAIFLLLVFLVIFDHAMLKGYFRDENQFIASGKLLQSAGMLPYRDYPYFHLPNLVFVYALIDSLTSFALLGARSFSVLCSWAMLTLLACLPGSLLAGRSWAVRLLVGLGAVLLLLPNPLFRYTTGLAWNHDAPVLLTLLAALAVLHTPQTNHPGRWSLLSGLLLGLAVGARLSFVTALPVFLLAFLFYPALSNKNKRLPPPAWFGAGFLISLLPSLLLFLASPREFFFGNWEYPQLNTRFRVDTAFSGAFTLPEKLAYFQDRVLSQPGSLILLGLWVLVMLLALLTLIRQRGGLFDCAFLFALPPFLLLGSFLPSPSWLQYFYAPLPFMLLGVLFALSQLEHAGQRGWKAAAAVFVLAALAVNILHFDQYPNLRVLLQPGRWFPLQTRVLGSQVAQRAGGRPVLTLSVVYPLDGGATIYPALATGPFALRVAQYVPQEQRRALKIFTSAELAALLTQQPPGAVLTGMEGEAESFLLEYAQAQGYQPVPLGELLLWLPK